MNKIHALKMAIELAKIAIQSSQISGSPDENDARCTADFIETLASRLEKMGEID